MEFFTDIIIILAILAVTAALVMTVISICHSLKANKRGWRENLIPVRLIEYATIGLVLLIAIPSLIIGGMTNACIVTAGILLVITLAALIYSKCSSTKRAIKFQA